MLHSFFSRYRFIFLILGLHLALYFFISLFHTVLPPQTASYHLNAYHFFPDTRFQSPPYFHLLSALGQFDAQWYFRIAALGYSGYAYAFFPAYPLLLAATSFFLSNLEIAAFILTQILYLILAWSVFKVFHYLAAPHIAKRAGWLLFTFPFSLFFHSYFAEALYLIFLLWFAFFWSRRRFLPAAVFLGLLSVTKGQAFFLLPIFALDALFHLRSRLAQLLPTLFFMNLPLLIWLLYCQYTGGSWQLPFTSLAAWRPALPVYLLPWYNLSWLLRSPFFPWHSFHASRLEALTALFAGFILYRSFPRLPRQLWLISLVLSVSPLLVKDFMSYSRYQSVSFPLFLYLARVLPAKFYWPILMLQLVLLFSASLFFINWFWWG